MSTVLASEVLSSWRALTLKAFRTLRLFAELGRKFARGDTTYETNLVELC
jgi:hypothetical protein